MPHVAFDVETTLPPERVQALLLDFSERRPAIWPGIEPSLYEVYSVGETSAEIKEGTKAPGMRVWARERYDWSQAGTIRWTVVESNFCEPGGYLEATLDPTGGGGTRIHLEWDRTGTTWSGKFVIGLITRLGGRPVARSFRRAFAPLEREQAS
jgi:hypothetical protein